MTYEQYIQTFWGVGPITGRCAEVTLAMVQMFPELRRVRGHYCCPVWGIREHWWLVAPGGEIVDPTARQFPGGGLGTYREWREGAEEPVGRCLNCGAYCFPSTMVTDCLCSDVCRVAVEASFQKST